MAYKQQILPTAQIEIRNIVAYMADVLCQPTAAASFLDEFDYQFELVADNPRIHGLSRMSELASLGYRSMLVKKYIALYYIEGDSVVVAHVFHQSQDYAHLI